MHVHGTLHRSSAQNVCWYTASSGQVHGTPYCIASPVEGTAGLRKNAKWKGLLVVGRSLLGVAPRTHLRSARCLPYIPIVSLDVENKCGLGSCESTILFTPTTHTFIRPVAPVAYQVILKPGIGQFREFEPRRVHTRVNSLGLFLVHKLTCGKRESVSKQHSMKNRRAVGLLNPMRDKN